MPQNDMINRAIERTLRELRKRGDFDDALLEAIESQLRSTPDTAALASTLASSATSPRNPIVGDGQVGTS